MSVKGKDVSQPLPLLKNVGAAPLVYFDGVPVWGIFNGTIEIELSARMLMPKPDGSVMVDMASAAHLRCSPRAALQLTEMLKAAIAKLSEQQSALLDDANSDEREGSRPN
jgi:hypothetical protein